MKALKQAINKKFVILSFSAFLITISIFIVLPPELNEKLYGGYVYPIVRKLLNWMNSWFSFPLFYIVIPMMVIDISTIILFYLFKRQWVKSLVYGLSYLLFITTLFFWLWGFHYNDPILVEQPSIQQLKMKKETVLKTFSRAEKYRNLLQVDSISPFRTTEMLKLMNDSSAYWLQQTMFLFQKKSRPIAKEIKFWPKGFLLRGGIVGMYFPFTGEATIDKGMHALRFPSTTLHELAHSMGFTNEGDCNMLAYIAAQFSADVYVRYSAELERVNEELYFVAMQDSMLYQEVREQLPVIISNDLQNIRAFHSKYYGKMAELGNWTNDQYLKTLSGENGVDEYWLGVLKLQMLEEKGLF